RVEQAVDPLPRRHLAPGVLLLDGALRPGVHGLGPAPLQIGDLASGGVDIAGSAGLAGGWGGQRGFGGHDQQGRPAGPAAAPSLAPLARGPAAAGTMCAMPASPPDVGVPLRAAALRAALVRRGSLWRDVRVVAE